MQKKMLLLLLAAAAIGRTGPASLGVIGGADGPTVIFVAASPQLGLWLWGAAGLAAAALGGWLLWRRHKSRRSQDHK